MRLSTSSGVKEEVEVVWGDPFDFGEWLGARGEEEGEPFRERMSFEEWELLWREGSGKVTFTEDGRKAGLLLERAGEAVAL
jgi:hypothetical protein